MKYTEPVVEMLGWFNHTINIDESTCLDLQWEALESENRRRNNAKNKQ